MFCVSDKGDRYVPTRLLATRLPTFEAGIQSLKF